MQVQRTLRPQQLFEKVVSKRGIQQFQTYVSSKLCVMPREEVEGIILYFVAQSKTTTFNETQKILFIESLECLGYGLRDRPEYQKNISAIMTTILMMFHDDNENIKLAAIGSVYSIFNCLADDCLSIFTLTFNQLLIVAFDESPNVRLAANFLNHTLKTLLNDAIFDHKQFDIQQFMGSLTSRFTLASPPLKEFLIDWIMAVEEITQFQISFYLPLFFRQVIYQLLSDNKNVRTKAEECLKKFLHVFRETFAIRGSISSKLKTFHAQFLLELVLDLISENISLEITYHALEWLELFTKFFSYEVKNKETVFLEPIFMGHFRKVLLVVLTSISDQLERMRKISMRINHLLLDIFPHVCQELTTAAAMEEMQLLIQENKSFTKVEAVIKWIKMLFKDNDPLMNLQIDRLIQQIVEKLCARNVTKNTFQLLQGSVFLTTSFDTFIHMLLYHFCINDSISPEPILRELISLEEAEIHFIAIAKKVSQFQNVQFKYRLIENLVFLLITDKSLRSLRLKLFDNYTRHNEQLLMSLFKDFSVNEPALLVFCFLAKQYFLITKLIVVMAQHETIIGDKSKSMLKMTNLLECPNLNHTRIDIHFDLYARKAFLCFLMAMPYCKYLKFLMQRLPLDDSEDQNKLSFRTIEEAEIKETQNLLLIYQMSVRETRYEPSMIS